MCKNTINEVFDIVYIVLLFVCCLTSWRKKGEIPLYPSPPFTQYPFSLLCSPPSTLSPLPPSSSHFFSSNFLPSTIPSLLSSFFNFIYSFILFLYHLFYNFLSFHSILRSAHSFSPLPLFHTLPCFSPHYNPVARFVCQSVAVSVQHPHHFISFIVDL